MLAELEGLGLSRTSIEVFFTLLATNGVSSEQFAYDQSMPEPLEIARFALSAGI